jgi:hypothetical protein
VNFIRPPLGDGISKQVLVLEQKLDFQLLKLKKFQAWLSAYLSAKAIDHMHLFRRLWLAQRYIINKNFKNLMIAFYDLC